MIELRGKMAADHILGRLAPRMAALADKGIIPCLSILRVGARDDDLSYERGIQKRFAAQGASVVVTEFPVDCSEEQFLQTLMQKNGDPSIHGILIFRPLPKHISETKVMQMLNPAKDVDGMTDASMAAVYRGDKNAFAPCTAQAVIDILTSNNIPLSGKKVVVVGRSLVIGRPVSMLFLRENATVTICHTKTEQLEATCQEADILVACAGKAEMVTRKFVKPGQILVDVGIHMKDDHLCGDVLRSDVEPIVEALTPVPGGVGSVTTSVLLEHVVLSAENKP